MGEIAAAAHAEIYVVHFTIRRAAMNKPMPPVLWPVAAGIISPLRLVVVPSIINPTDIGVASALPELFTRLQFRSRPGKSVSCLRQVVPLLGD